MAVLALIDFFRLGGGRLLLWILDPPFAAFYEVSLSQEAQQCFCSTHHKAPVFLRIRSLL